MTDAPDLPPEQDAVRRLLADARHRGATPPEVVARLDETLAGLLSERAGTPGSSTPAGTTDPSVRAPAAPVVDLAARRRRRAGVGLLAAAAVVVAGVAIGQGLPTTSGSDDSAASSADGGDAGGAETFAEQDDSAGGGADPSEQLAAPDSKSQQAAPDAGLPVVSTLDAALPERLLGLRAGATSRSEAFRSLDTIGACRSTPTGPGRRVTVEVDGQTGVVVYRAPDGPTQDVAVYVCGTPEPVRTVTVPAP